MNESLKQQNGQTYGTLEEANLSAVERARLLEQFRGGNGLDEFDDEFNEEDQKATVYSILNALLGVSIFAVPWGFERSGFLGGSLIVWAVAYGCYETIRILLVSQGMLFDRTGKTMSYPDMVRETMPEPMPKVVKCATLISCVGGCVGYLIFLSEVCLQLLGWTQTGSVLAACVPLIGLSWLKGFKELEVFSFINFCVIIASLLYVVLDGVLNVQPAAAEGVPLFAPLPSTMQFVGPATFTFTVHYMIVSMGGEYTAREASRPGSPLRTPRDGSRRMPETTQHVLLKPLAKGFYIAGLVIVIFGAASYILFAHSEVQYDDDHNLHVLPGCEHGVCQNIVMNLSANGTRTVLGLALLPMIFITYTLVMAPAREHVEEALLKFVDSDNEVLTRGCSMTIRAGLVLFTAAVAAGCPYFGSTLGTVGGITDAFQAFVLPCIIFMSVKSGVGGVAQQWLYWVIMILGSCLIISTMISVVQMFSSGAP